MTKRPIFIVLLALAAIGVVVVAIPRAILEWHVHKIANDRSALLAALKAPVDTWEWQALEEYAGRHEGQKTLRLAYAGTVLRWTFPSHYKTAPYDGESLDSKAPDITLIPQRSGSRWLLAGMADSLFVKVEDGENAPSPRDGVDVPFVEIGKFVSSSHSKLPNKIAGLATPSKGPVLSKDGRHLYVVRASDAILPQSVRTEGFPKTVNEVLGNDACVVYVTFSE